MKFIPYSGFDVYLANNLYSFKNLKGDKPDKLCKPVENNEEKTTNPRKSEDVKILMPDFEQVKISAPRTLDTDRILMSTTLHNESLSPKHRESLNPFINPKHKDLVSGSKIVSKPNQNEEVSKPIALMQLQESGSKTIFKPNQNEEVSKPIALMELQEIHHKITASHGDQQVLSQAYIHSLENENENEKGDKNQGLKIEKTERNDEDVKKSFKRKVTNLKSPRKKSIAASLMRKSSWKDKEKQQTLGENFKNYSKMKEKGDVLNIEFKDFLKGRWNTNFLKKIKALQIATSKIKNDLDITNIMQKFQEVDKLKLILFSKEQLMLFNLIAKPEIFVDEERVSEKDPGIMISKNLQKIDQRSDENFLDLMLYYNKIKKKEGDDDLDGRLVRLIDNDMKNYFEV